MIDEDVYREVYRRVNRRACVFEKAILSGGCGCSLGQRLLLAEREAMSCSVPGARRTCAALCDLLRHKSRFALALRKVGGPLPHGPEIKIQVGGLLGVQGLFDPADRKTVSDICAVVAKAAARYPEFEQLPFGEIVKSVVAYQGRKRKRR